MLFFHERSHFPAVRETHLLNISVCVLVISACVLAIIDNDRKKYARNDFDIDIYAIFVQWFPFPAWCGATLRPKLPVCCDAWFHRCIWISRQWLYWSQVLSFRSQHHISFKPLESATISCELVVKKQISAVPETNKGSIDER